MAAASFTATSPTSWVSIFRPSHLSEDVQNVTGLDPFLP